VVLMRMDSLVRVVEVDLRVVNLWRRRWRRRHVKHDSSSASALAPDGRYRLMAAVKDIVADAALLW
jgi:hypothetical protein